jgi:hypothetical protein
MAKIELETQINALQGFVELAKAKGITNGQDEAVATALKTLRWIQAHSDEIKLAGLIKRDSMVREIFQEFPAAKISVVREAAKKAAGVDPGMNGGGE